VKLTRDGGTSQRIATCCRVILLAHQGETNVAIAGQLGLSRPTVLGARAAFAKNGLKALTDVRKRKRNGRVLTPELEQRILDATLKTRPLDNSTHWSVRTLAKHLRMEIDVVHQPLILQRLSQACVGNGARARASARTTMHRDSRGAETRNLATAPARLSHTTGLAAVAHQVREPRPAAKGHPIHAEEVVANGEAP